MRWSSSSPQYGVLIGAIAAPAVAAQGICDRAGGGRRHEHLNFAPVVLNVPDGVDVRKVDLSIELADPGLSRPAQVGPGAPPSGP